MKPRAVIVDDHVLVAEALAKFLEPACDVIGIYSDPRILLREAASLRPDVVMMDVAMPYMNGLEAAQALRKLVPATRIIVVTMNEDPDLAVDAIQMGADGYLLKRSAPSELRSAVREVLSHRTYITPLLNAALKQKRQRRPSGQLTERQREVLRLLAKGHSMKQVGGILNVSPRTVAFHKYRLMESLDVESTAELIRFALRTGLV